MEIAVYPENDGRNNKQAKGDEPGQEEKGCFYGSIQGCVGPGKVSVFNVRETLFMEVMQLKRATSVCSAVS